MAIQQNELKLYKSATVNDTTANGGRISANEIADAVKNNLWPDAPQAERTAGSTKYRKTFFKAASAENPPLTTPKIFIETFTPGDDAVYLFPGTQRDTQGDLTGAERVYGAGQLNANVTAGATSIDVLVEDGAALPFANGDLIRISDKTSVDDVGGNEEYLRLAATGGVSYVGDVATLTLDTGVTAGNSYTAAATRVAAVIEAADIQPGYDNKRISSAAGTFDDVTYPIAVDSVGTVEETITVTFTSATTFDVVGDTLGSLGSGSTGVDFTPINPDFGAAYFTMPAAAWGGTWASGDTLSFQTHPAAAPVWQKRVIPPGAASLTGDKVIVAIDGESA